MSSNSHCPLSSPHANLSALGSSTANVTTTPALTADIPATWKDVGPTRPHHGNMRSALSAPESTSTQAVATGATHEPPTPVLPPAKRPRHEGAPSSTRGHGESYAHLRASVHAALVANPPSLSPAAKVALALELLHARQLELDLASAREAMHALVTIPPPPPPSSPRLRRDSVIGPASSTDTAEQGGVQDLQDSPTLVGSTDVIPMRSTGSTSVKDCVPMPDSTGTAVE